MADKYKVGDLVRVRNDIIAGVQYNRFLAPVCVNEYKNDIYEVIKKRTCSCGCDTTMYTISPDTNHCIWTDDMLEPGGKLYETEIDIDNLF